MIIEKKHFGMVDGKTVTLFRMKNSNGMEISIMNLGACITTLKVPDRNGNFADIVLGYDDLAGYIVNDGYFGACVGRYANRIAGATFDLNGVSYKLTNNDFGNTLHGGHGWSNRLFDFHPHGSSLEFSLFDNRGADGFPGYISASIKYTLTNDNSIEIEYTAVSDADTVLNLSNHSYFNLSGAPEILDHQLMISADFYTPIDSSLIPTGEIVPVDGTEFDFRTLRRIGSGFYDHNFVLRDTKPNAILYDSSTGRKMEIETDMPGIQLYCSNMLTDRVGKYNKHVGRFGGICLETQFFPNSPNIPQFPSSVLKAGQIYKHKTVYKFSCV